jgi:serine O-acetyltransferase
MHRAAPSPSLRAQLLADLAENWRHRSLGRTPQGWADIVRSLGDLRFVPVVLVRLTTAAGHDAGPVRTIVSRLASIANRFLFGIECASQATIGPGLYFPHTGGIIIGAASIGARCVLYHQVTLGATVIDMPFTPHLRPAVGDDVVIASGAKVLGGVHVGDRAVVAANAVVVDDVHPDTVVGGVPARRLKRRTGVDE